jgi:putative redox protein
MKIQTVWEKNMRFSVGGGGHQISMDAKKPIGEDTALNPKELVLAGLSGCTAMDVVALLRKYKQSPESFEINANTELTQATPAIFKEVHLRFVVKGNVEPAKLIEAVELSQTKYCGVSAMLGKAVPIHYSVELNGEQIHSGASTF